MIRLYNIILIVNVYVYVFFELCSLELAIRSTNVVFNLQLSSTKFCFKL